MPMRSKIAATLLSLALCVPLARAAQPMQNFPTFTQQVLVGIEGSKGPFVGEAPRAQHRIEALTLNHQLTMPWRDGRPLGARQHEPIRFTKLTGAADLQLYQALIGNEALPSVVIDFVMALNDGRIDVLQSITLRDARIVGIHRTAEADGKGGTRWLEEVSVAFTRFEIRDHRAGGTVVDELKLIR